MWITALTWILNKINIKSIIIITVSSFFIYLIFMGKSFITRLETNTANLYKQNTALLEQNNEVLKTNKNNATIYKKLKKDIELNDSITEILIEKIEGIQNVKITERTIIQKAQGSCLDADYPDSIIASGILRWEETAVTGDSN